MRQPSLLFVASFLCFASMASAAPNIYDVTVDTSSISGTAGSLDFNFNPGPLVTQAASLQILNFTSNGALAGTPTLIGDVAGTLPTTLSFDNGTAFNDYFEGFKFVSTLSFQVSLFGPALSSPDGTSTSGSTFAFSMFSDALGTTPVLTSDTTDGFAFTVGVNLDGTTTVTNSSAQTTVVPATTPAVPGPGTLPLMATGIGLWLAFRFRLQRRYQAAVFSDTCSEIDEFASENELDVAAAPRHSTDNSPGGRARDGDAG
jgi:hypothetical protein